MSDEQTSEKGTPTGPEELDTTPPMPTKGEGKWQMPEPVYRQTSGYLPQGYADQVVENFGAPTAAEPAEAAPPVAESPSTPAPADIPPPPPVDEEEDFSEAATEDLSVSSEFSGSEQAAVTAQPALSAPTYQAAAVAPSNSGSVGMIAIILAIIGIFVFAVLLIAVVYYLFLAEPAAANNF